MCGRYAAFLPAEAIVALFAIKGAVPNWAPTWNMAPTRDAPIVRLHPEEGDRRLDLLRWGLIPHWAKDPKSVRMTINARSETIASTPMFRDAFNRGRRCLVPADAFYEWQTVGATAAADHPGETPGAGKSKSGKARSTKQPWAIAREDGAPLVFAGLWEGWRGADGTVIRSFTIATTTANQTLRPLHERMPVVLEREDWPLWLGETEGDPATLLRPSAAGFRTWRVGVAVNNVRNDVADLLNPA